MKMRPMLLAVMFASVATSSAQALDRNVTFVNKYPYQVSEINASNVHKPEFGDINIISTGNPLDTDESYSHDFDETDDGDGYCRFDILVKFRKGPIPEREYHNVNVCDISEFVIK